MYLYDFKTFEAKNIGDLYHFTDHHSLISILKSDKLKASKLEGIDVRKTINDTSINEYYISFTRNKNLNKESREFKRSNFRITFNANKLSENYKITPYNYYDTTYTKLPNTFESEERIYFKKGYKPYIKDIKKYIKEITFLNEPEDIFYINLRNVFFSEISTVDFLKNMFENPKNYRKKLLNSFINKKLAYTFNVY
jgi:hypothetical protein